MRFAAAGCSPHSRKPFDEIVDVGQMVIDVAGCRACEPAAAGDAAKQLQQAAIARTVDAGRPHDRHLDAGARRRLARQPLAFELRLLIDVARPERRVFVRRRMLDVAVDADRAAVHDAADAGARRPLRRAPRPHGVDGAIDARRRGRPAGRSRRCDRRRRRRRRARASACAVAQIAGDERRCRRSSRSPRRPRGRAPARGRRSPRAASARARWPPVNPVAPVTRARTVRRRR